MRTSSKLDFKKRTVTAVLVCGTHQPFWKFLPCSYYSYLSGTSFSFFYAIAHLWELLNDKLYIHLVKNSNKKKKNYEQHLFSDLLLCVKLLLLL